MTKSKGGRPPLPEGERMTRIHVYLSPSQVTELDDLVRRGRAAGNFTLSRNDLLRRAVFEFCANAAIDAIMPTPIRRTPSGRALRRPKS